MSGVPLRTPSDRAVVARNPLLEAPPVVATTPDGDFVGTVLADRYRLLCPLAEGGMGRVYLGEHVAIGRTVAVKVLARRWADDETQRRRFLQEARAASKVAHDNVIEILDVGDAPNGSVFMVMEHLEGESLADLVTREAPLSWPRIKRIALQICRALCAAHERGVLHRDLKPENCWRAKRGANRDFIKVLDFGIAKIVGDPSDPHSSLTRAGSVFGTPEYMSPEQARGQRVDARTDVYAMGILLFELATGDVPFTGVGFMEILTQQVSAIPPRPSAAAPAASIPLALEPLIERALAKDPDARFQSMRELAEAIAAIPTAAPQPVPPPNEPVARGAGAGPSRTAPIEVVWLLLGVITLLTLGLVATVLLR